MNASKKKVVYLLLTMLFLTSCTLSAPTASPAPTTADSSKPTTRAPEQATASSDVAHILQLVIDLPALQKYYHVDDAPNRKPLFILKNELIASEPQLSKFDEPVKFATCDQLKATNQPYLEFVKLETRGDTAAVVFRYRVEGIEGRLTFDRQNDAWRVQEQQLVEAKFTDRGCVSTNGAQGGKDRP
jgi:hypothetical protein